MKHLKKFEELSPQTYKNAAEILNNKIGHTRRGEELLQHAHNIENNRKLKVKDAIGEYDFLTSSGNIKANISNVDILYMADDEERKDIEDLMSLFREDKDRKLFAYIDINFTVGLFISLSIHIFQGGKFVPDISLDTNADAISIFANRKSANLFIKYIKDFLTESFPISDMIILSGIDEENQSSNLKKFYDMLDNIDVHKLYDLSYKDERNYDVSIVKEK
jgi:hypothetical protein